MDQSRIDRIAAMLMELRAGADPIPADDPGEAPADLAEAYGVQEATVELMAGQSIRPIGYKLGATNQAARDMLGVDGPFRGRLYDGLARASGATVARGPHLQVWEVEIGLKIGTDLDPSGAPFDAAAIEAATAAVLPAIEIVGTVFRPFNKAPVTRLVADNAVHGLWIHGDEVTDWSGLDLMNDPVTLSFDGEQKAQGKGSNVDGGPFGAAAGLANDLAAIGRGLKAGDYITTGTVTPIVPMGDEREIVADFGPMGTVSLTFS